MFLSILSINEAKLILKLGTTSVHRFWNTSHHTKSLRPVLISTHLICLQHNHSFLKIATDGSGVVLQTHKKQPMRCQHTVAFLEPSTQDCDSFLLWDRWALKGIFSVTKAVQFLVFHTAKLSEGTTKTDSFTLNNPRKVSKGILQRYALFAQRWVHNVVLRDWFYP